MTYHQFCGNFLESKASVISRYTDYSLGESVPALLWGDIRPENVGECQEWGIVFATYQVSTKHIWQHRTITVVPKQRGIHPLHYLSHPVCQGR